MALAVLVGATALAFARLFRKPVLLLSGDTLLHSLPVHRLLGASLEERRFSFWNPEVAFGFPLYAEAIGGLLHPWKLALFAAFDWRTAHDLVYVSSFFLTGAFAFATARSLGLAPVFSLIAGLGVLFSPAVLSGAYNAAYAHSLAWSAAALLAFERWYRTPGFASATALAVALALLLLAGYPPQIYATTLCLGSMLAVRLVAERTRFLPLAAGFAAAGALALCLAALQLLPLFELVSRSVRQEAVVPLQALPWLGFVRGIVLTNDPAFYRSGRFVFFYASLGSVLALLAVGFLPLLVDRVAVSYAAAITLCVAIARGPSSPVFDAARAVLPGFDRLRLVTPFLAASVVPVGLLFAMSLHAGAARPLGRARGVAGLAALALLAWAVATYATRLTPSYLGAEAAVLALTGAAFFAARRAGRPAWAGAAVAAGLLVEIAGLKPDFLTPLPDALLDERRPLARFLVNAAAEASGSRVAPLRTRDAVRARRMVVLQHWKENRYTELIRLNLRLLTPELNLLDGVASTEMHGSLPLAAYADVQARLEREILGLDSPPPGQRLLDRLGVRWVVGSRLARALAPDLRPVWRHPEADIEVYENPNARGLLQAFPGAAPEGVRPGELVRSALPAWVERTVEAIPWVDPEVGAAGELDLAEPGIVFVAIPAYPGWSATLDGRRAPLGATPDFGMALAAPAGRHRVVVQFVPYVFHVGAAVSAATSLALLGVGLARRRAGRRAA